MAQGPDWKPLELPGEPTLTAEGAHLRSKWSSCSSYREVRGGVENATRPHIAAAVLLAASIFLSSTPRFLAHRPTLFSLGAARLPCSRHKQIPKVSSTNPSLSESDREGWCLIPLVFLGVGILAPLSRAPAKAHARQMAPRADKRQTASAPPSRISCPF